MFVNLQSEHLSHIHYTSSNVGITELASKVRQGSGKESICCIWGFMVILPRNSPVSHKDQMEQQLCGPWVYHARVSFRKQKPLKPFLAWNDQTKYKGLDVYKVAEGLWRANLNLSLHKQIPEQYYWLTHPRTCYSQHNQEKWRMEGEKERKEPIWNL